MTTYFDVTVPSSALWVEQVMKIMFKLTFTKMT